MMTMTIDTVLLVTANVRLDVQNRKIIFSSRNVRLRFGSLLCYRENGTAIREDEGSCDCLWFSRTQGRKIDTGRITENRERVLGKIGVFANGIYFAKFNV